MISPQELQNKKFEKAMFGGYDMAGIDEFLDALIPDYTALYKENMTLKNKMKVLVDKIEEYRSVDEEMRKALYQAQISSKEIIQKAQSESEQMMAAARAEAERMLANAHAEAEGRVADMQQAIQAEQQRHHAGLSSLFPTAIPSAQPENISAFQTAGIHLTRDAPDDKRQAPSGLPVRFPPSARAFPQVRPFP